MSLPGYSLIARGGRGFHRATCPHSIHDQRLAIGAAFCSCHSKKLGSEAESNGERGRATAQGGAGDPVSIPATGRVTRIHPHYSHPLGLWAKVCETPWSLSPPRRVTLHSIAFPPCPPVAPYPKYPTSPIQDPAALLPDPAHPFSALRNTSRHGRFDFEI